MVPDSWYRFDVTARMSSTGGDILLAIDGSNDVAELIPRQHDRPRSTSCCSGVTLVNSAIESLTLYVDDVEISEQ